MLLYSITVVPKIGTMISYAKIMQMGKLSPGPVKQDQFQYHENGKTTSVKHNLTQIGFFAGLLTRSFTFREAFLMAVAYNNLCFMVACHLW